MTTLLNGYELSNHPKAGDAMKLINFMKSTKKRAMSHEQVLLVLQSAAQKIRADEGLNFVFNRLQELGMYTNPANLPF